MYVGNLIKQLHDAETSLASELRKVGDHHKVEHDVFYLCHSLAKRTDTRASQLRPFGDRYGKALKSDEGEGLFETVASKLRRASSVLSGRRSATGLLLLYDLRQLYVATQEAQILWLMLAQAGQALRDRELDELAGVAHEEVQTQAQWAKTKLKEVAPQILVFS